MADGNQQIEEPVLEEEARNAQKEFNVILDVLGVPLRADFSNQKLPPRRRWRGGCLLGLPDLVPVPDPRAGVGFCRRVEEGEDRGKLMVTVENRGSADAHASVTRVIFSPGETSEKSSDVPTPPIPAGRSVDLQPLEIPGSCFDPDCNFQIIVDVNNEVDEFNQANNTAFGQCLG